MPLSAGGYLVDIKAYQKARYKFTEQPWSQVFNSNNISTHHRPDYCQGHILILSLDFPLASKEPA